MKIPAVKIESQMKESRENQWKYKMKTVSQKQERELQNNKRNMKSDNEKALDRI